MFAAIFAAVSARARCCIVAGRVVGRQQASLAMTIAEQLRTPEVAASLVNLADSQQSVAKIFGEHLRTQQVAASVHGAATSANDPAAGATIGPTGAATTSDAKGSTGTYSVDDR